MSHLSHGPSYFLLVAAALSQGSCTHPELSFGPRAEAKADSAGVSAQQVAGLDQESQGEPGHEAAGQKDPKEEAPCL